MMKPRAMSKKTTAKKEDKTKMMRGGMVKDTKAKMARGGKATKMMRGGMTKKK